MIRSNRSPSSHSPFALCITKQSSWCRIKVLSLGSAVRSILLKCSLVLCGVWLMRSKGLLDWAERRWQLAPIELNIWRNVPWPYDQIVEVDVRVREDLTGSLRKQSWRQSDEPQPLHQFIHSSIHLCRCAVLGYVSNVYTQFNSMQFNSIWFQTLLYTKRSVWSIFPAHTYLSCSNVCRSISFNINRVYRTSSG